MGMSGTVKKLLKIFAVIIGVVLIFAVLFVGWLTVTEYKPEATEPLSISGKAEKSISAGESISVLTFNIGYADLGKGSDFVLDGGKNGVNNNEEGICANIEGILGIIEEADADILLLQEVDEDSKRSSKIDQTAIIMEKFGGESSFALNYSCGFVPFPFPPMGKVNSGIMTVSDYATAGAERYSLPCPFSWPVSAANLKRCLLVSYMDIEGSDKQLVTVNLHLEAYDDGEGKIAQTKMLWEVLENEYAKGNYVIAGGDFNQTFPGSLEKFPIKSPELWTPGILEESALPEGWNYIFDDSVPTCRLLNMPYDPMNEATQHYVIDGFIVSPNIEVLSVGTIGAEFEFSDHNPVVMEIKFK